jgi:acyl-homoserine lactone acylase PvdQ
MSRLAASLALGAALTFACSAAARAADFAATARNISPSGQLGGVPVPPGADTQAKMYDALTPLFNHVTDADIQADFKSEAFGVGSDGPGTPEAVPFKGVTLVRDRFDVPHITATTRDGVTFAMGWTLAEDRALLLQQARYPARLAALDAPNINAFGLVAGLKQFTPTRQVDRIILRNELRALRSQGRDGRRLLHDVDVYVRGINARLRHDHANVKPWTRVDVFAANALAGQLFGEGGGGEAQRSELLGSLQRRLGAARGMRLFDDLTEHNDADTPSTLTRAFRYEPIPRRHPGSVILDPGSLKLTDRPATSVARTATARRRWASNFLMVSARRSATGHPLLVAGPQIGYFYPGLTLEADVKGPGFEARGATAPGFAGNILIGRGPDFAWSLTSAGSDLVDTFAETLCGHSSTRYLYTGRCRRMGRVNAGVLQGAGRIVYRTTVHGPVIGYATVHGRRVALARKRASFGRDILWQLPFRAMTLNQVRSPQTFFRAMARSPYTFNGAYADDRNIAMFSAGRLPLRARGVDPRLPTKGTGRYEWRGFEKASAHPHQVNPPTGVLVNWNNRPAPDWGAADDNWEYGSAQRVQMLLAGLTAPKQTLAAVVAAMNGAATQDLRNVALTPTLGRLLAAVPAPDARAARMLALLEGWRATGSSRLDRDLDGLMDAGPAPAIMDALYPHVFSAVMGPALGPQLDQLRAAVGDIGPGSGFTGGGIAYLDKDLRRLAGARFADPFRTRFCGGGNLAACARALWAAFDAAAADLHAAQGTADPDAWRSDANAERLHFVPGLLPTTIRYTNRPSGIQQVISFAGHRPRRGPGAPPRGRCTPACRRPPRASRSSAAPCSPRRSVCAARRRRALRLRPRRQPDVDRARASAGGARRRRGRHVRLRQWPRSAPCS